MHHTFKTLLVMAWLLAASATTLPAQTYLGIHTSHYDPLRSVLFNPASPIASGMKWEVNLFSTDIRFTQDYLKVVKGNGEWDLEEILNGKDKTGLFYAEVLLPGFMFKSEKAGAFTFYLRGRSIVNVNNVSEDALTTMFNYPNNIYQWSSTIEDEQLDARAHSFSELSLGYSRTLFENDLHRISAGATIKALSPIAAGSGSGNLDITVDIDAGTANFGNTEIVAYSSEIFNYTVADNYQFKYRIAGFGADLGLIYELHNGRGHQQLVRKNRVKRPEPGYFLKAGIAVLDLGSIRHEHSLQSRTFQADGSTVDLSTVTEADSGFVNLDEVMNAFGTPTLPLGSFTAPLPTALTLFAELKITRGLYLNVSSYSALGSSDDATRPRAKFQHVLAFTPRFELPWVGVQVPVSYSSVGRMEIGMSLRVGQFAIGSTGLISALWKNEVSSFDVHMAFAFGRAYRKKEVVPGPGPEPGELETPVDTPDMDTTE